MKLRILGSIFVTIVFFTLSLMLVAQTNAQSCGGVRIHKLLNGLLKSSQTKS